MKKILITTMLGIATTAAFGAASLRAPQMGGTSTVAAPTATNTARAGTLRTQTMKTSSISTPSVTTTQSIATPVSTETTDARLSLLKGIKGFNPGKIKDTTATQQQDLTEINSRIEDLRAQLDQAEAAQSNVITEANIDAKIDQKLATLGTSTGAKDTYSKTEVDALLSNIVKKLPQIDDRGNINMTDPNGTIVVMPRYWYITYLDFDAPITNRGDLYGFSGNVTYTTIENWVNNTICSASTAYYNRIACCLAGYNLEEEVFNTRSIYHGYDVFDSEIVERDGVLFLRRRVGTAEPDPATYLHHALCGDPSQSQSNCWVELGDDSLNATFCGVKISYAHVYTSLDRPHYDLIDTVSNHGIVTRYVFKTNASEEQIYEFIDNWCNGASAWCSSGGIFPNEPNYPNETIFHIVKRTVGHAIPGQQMVNADGHMGFRTTYLINVHNNIYNNDPVAYVTQEICNNNDVGLCYVTGVIDNTEAYGLEVMNRDLEAFYNVFVFSEIAREDTLPAEYNSTQQ